MKKTALIIIAVVVGISLFSMWLPGQSTGWRIGWIGTNYNGHMTARYFLYTGEAAKQIRGITGETIRIRYDSVVKSGTLSMSLIKPDGDVIQLPVNLGGEYTLKMTESGRYTIVIRGRKTRGSYDVSWGKAK